MNLISASIIKKNMIETEFQNYSIFIGKNKNENAELLEKSNPKDYWIHVKDLSSGHGIIKNPTGKRIPNKIIKRACCLLKSSNDKHKCINKLKFDVTKRENITLTQNIGEVIISNSKIFII